MASRISGVGVHTIRAWEKRYKALEPRRDSSGHRVYTKTDIEKLMLLSELCLLGYSISKVANLSQVDLKDLLKVLGKSEESINKLDFRLVEDVSSLDLAQSLSILKFALINYKVDVISQELGKLKNLLSARDYALTIVMPLCHELNQAFKNGDFNVHQYDALKALIRFKLSFYLFRTEKHESTADYTVLCNLEGSDDLKMGCVGLLCANYAINFTFAGTLSAEAFIEFMKFSPAKTFIIGISSYQSDSALDKIVQKCLPENEIIILGAARKIFNTSAKKIITLESIQGVDDFLARRLS